MPAIAPAEFAFVSGLHALPDNGARFWAEASVPNFFLTRTWFECLLTAGTQSGRPDCGRRAALGGACRRFAPGSVPWCTLSPGPRP